MAGTFKDVYENHEQNADGEHTGPVTSSFRARGTGTSSGGLTLKIRGQGTEERGEGGFEGKLQRLSSTLTCTAE